MINRYVLILVCNNPDHTDCSGTVYPAEGLVECKHFLRNSNLLDGLYGTAWSRYDTGRWLNKDEEACWCVVQSKCNNDFIFLDKSEHFVKFRTGNVVCSKSRIECEEFIKLEGYDNVDYWRRTW